MTDKSGSTDREWWNQMYVDEGEPEEFAPEDLLVTELDGLAPGAALDLGCGHGVNAIWLAERGWRVTGVDWSDEAIRRARAEAEKRGLDVHFEVADIAEWTSSEKFDLVINTYALPSAAEKRQKTLLTASSAVARGGTLLVVEWDVSLADKDHWEESDLVSVDELRTGILGLVIDRAEVIEVDFSAHRAREGSHGEDGEAGHDHGLSHGRDDEAKEMWQAAFVRAHRPDNDSRQENRS